jgi:hypothetical protein
MVKPLAIASPMDLDAIASVYLLRRAVGENIEVRYLDHRVIENSVADYILDSPHGTAKVMRFDHHDTNEYTCSAMKVVEYFGMGSAERRLASAVCWQDNAGWRMLGRDGMDNLLDSALKCLMASGMSTDEIEAVFRTVFDAMIVKFREDESLIQEVKRKIIFASEGNEVLAVNGDFPKDILFQEYSPKLLVKHSRWGVSVTRSAKLQEPDLNDFKEELKKISKKNFGRWFFHPQGFYFGYSTSPEKREKIPVDAKVLSAKLVEFLHKNSK